MTLVVRPVLVFLRGRRMRRSVIKGVGRPIGDLDGILPVVGWDQRVRVGFRYDRHGRVRVSTRP